MRTLSFCLLLALASAAGAQVQPGDAVVAVRLPGNPATQLFAVDVTTGNITALPRFPADVLPPLAVDFDPIDGELVLAVDAGGTSRVFRYTMVGGVPGAERLLGDFPAGLTQLGFSGQDVIACVDGPMGGIYRMSRYGGTASLAFAQPYLTAMQSWGAATYAVIAWSGNQGPPVTDPGVGIVDLISGLFTLGPDTFPNFAHPGITGVMDMPTALPRQLMSHTDGAVTMHTMFLGVPPAVIPVQPAVPPGGAVAMKAALPYGISPLVLGGTAFPNLWMVDPWATPAVRSTVAGPFPGDPVDFAVSPAGTASLAFFGTSCGPTAMSVGTTGVPQIGSPTFQVNLSQATRNAPTVFTIGFTDQMGGVLPFRLPSGCDLLVSPDASIFHLTSPAGTATQALPVPGNPGLVGLRLFAQWLQAPSLPFATSPGLAIRIGT